MIGAYLHKNHLSIMFLKLYIFLTKMVENLGHGLDFIVQNFGYQSFIEFKNSLMSMSPNSLLMFVPIATIITTLEVWTGLGIIPLTAFVLLLTLELITGITASKIKGIPIQSKKFSRFGLKAFTWIMLLFFVNSMALNYAYSTLAADIMKYQVFNWIHTVIVLYVSAEYLISILENLSVISGKDNSVLINAIKNKTKQFLNSEDGFAFVDDIKILCDVNGKIIKANENAINFFEIQTYLDKSVYFKDLIKAESKETYDEAISQLLEQGATNTQINLWLNPTQTETKSKVILRKVEPNIYILIP